MDKKTPFSIILKLVINGDIDPWNVDIVDLADKYLEELKKLDIPDFKVASKFINTAVILLKMKILALGLDNEDKKSKKRKKRILGIKRYYTIEEIAHILKNFVEPPINSKKYKKSSQRKVYRRKKGEDIKEIPLFKATLEEAIKLLKEELKNFNKDIIDFDELKYPDKIQSFVGLLFLNYENFIDIYQNEPFGKLKIKKVNL